MIMLGVARLARARWLLANLPATIARRTAATHAITENNPLKIFWGSQTGNAHGFAEELGMEALSLGVPHEVVDLASFDPDQLAPGSSAAFLTACYGMGEPTDNARDFYHWLMETDTDLTGVDFAVFGLGNSRTHCERFNVVGINVDRRLEELGATRILPRVDGDDSDCIECQFDEWQGSLLTMLSSFQQGEEVASNSEKEVRGLSASEENEEIAVCDNAPSSNPVPPYHVRFEPTGDARVTALTSHFFDSVLRPKVYKDATSLMRIVAKKELSPKSDRSTQEILLSLEPLCENRDAPGEAARVAYHTGDHLVVHPPNIPSVVDEWVSLLASRTCGGDGCLPVTEETVDALYTVHRTIASGRVSVPLETALTPREMLTYCLDLQAMPSPKSVRSLAALCSRSEEANALVSFAEKDAYRAEIQDNARTILDLAREFESMQISLDYLVTHLPILQPRYYSISSCSDTHPDDVGITYRVLEYVTKRGTPRCGVCTAYLSSRGLDDVLPAYVWASDFKLPDDRRTPVLMIAGGTGIAPFKAFLEENLHFGTQQLRPYTLFYGMRDPSEYVYEELISQAEAAGALQHKHIAYSQSVPCAALGEPQQQQQPAFLHDELERHGSSVFDILSNNGCVYVCGGASGFGPAVTQAMKNIIQREGGLTRAQAEEYFSSLMASKRYFEDLSD